jgi:ATP-dependent DNA helicase RecG
MDVAAAVELHRRLAGEPALRGRHGALLHGRMKADEKDAVMRAFIAGETAYLVATTVIEVGVDVPNASLMIVEHPERHGLSQLHQLRGRVGRGRQPAHLFLIRRPGAGEEARRRLEVLVRVTDGFRIAEEDLRLRGPGEFFGERQSGLPPLKVADPIAQPHLLEASRREARTLVASPSGDLREGPYWRRLETRFGDRLRLYGVG